MPGGIESVDTPSGGFLLHPPKADSHLLEPMVILATEFMRPTHAPHLENEISAIHVPVRRTRRSALETCECGVFLPGTALDDNGNGSARIPDKR